MSTPQPKTPERAKNTDRWGFRRRPGIVRGQIRNISRSIGICDFGELIICDFELFVDDDVPPVSVRMAGTNFNQDIPNEHLAEVRDDGSRPIITNRLDLSHGGEVVAYYPGRTDPPASVMRLRGLSMVIGPILFALILLGLFLFFFG